MKRPRDRPLPEPEHMFKGPSSEPAARYPAKLHARRVATELDVSAGLVYLAGQTERQLEDSDQSVPFRQRRYFFYLAGADFPGCHVTYDVAADKLILWVPYVAPKDVLWYGSTPSPEECLRRFDVDKVGHVGDLAVYVDGFRASNPSRTVYVLHGNQMPFKNGPARSKHPVDDTSLKPAMDRARVVKTDYEIAMIRRANDISSAAHRAVASRLVHLRTEREVEAVFQASCAMRGTRTQAYPIIAGAGANAATLHYDANDQPLANCELLLLDAGCEWNCYASDVTRTLPLAGAFSPRAAAVYDVVERMQAICIKGVRPGACFRCLQLSASQVALDGLLRMGVLKGDREKIWRAGTVAAFFPHGLGHHVGLEVHDVDGGEPLLATDAAMIGGKRVTVTPEALISMMTGGDEAAAAAVEGRGGGGGKGLRPNMVVTIEPGIYFCRPYLEASFVHDQVHGRFIDADVLETFYSVGGVRIEDDILVTEDGGENLTSAPRGSELLEVLVDAAAS
ncbi:hypothetical protein XA68_11011 [Ophiocordyceps unilateralis]|uniref:Xaa-Pro aminopeptidase n=1 Tax=Ophiocordyceps unilateralis TaxID=268505 RepID=A0A2A9PHR1_OPHUN|nr:hypothetical protein XA68_11011 [Ophiocordyceps unilateralis]